MTSSSASVCARVVTRRNQLGEFDEKQVYQAGQEGLTAFLMGLAAVARARPSCVGGCLSILMGDITGRDRERRREMGMCRREGLCRDGPSLALMCSPVERPLGRRDVEVGEPAQ